MPLKGKRFKLVHKKELGIDSISLNPDSVLKTVLRIAEVEKGKAGFIIVFVRGDCLPYLLN